MSAIWSKSGDQLVDIRGRPLIGAVAEFFLASTTTPIVVYQDEGLTTPVTDPVITDGNGIWPQVFINDALLYYRWRTKKSPTGAVLSDFIKVPALGPTWWASQAAPVVDPNALLQTGDEIFRADGVSRGGCVRGNGRTIGNASSGATERANADTQNLYLYYWNTSTAYAVSGGRGASAAADYAANKTLTLPDMRGRVPVGLDNMGNALAGRLPAANAVNASGGASTIALAIGQMPAHDHGGSVAPGGGHAHTVDLATGTSMNAGGTPIIGNTATAPAATSTAPDHTHAIGAQGGGAAHANDQPWLAGGWFIKL